MAIDLSKVSTEDLRKDLTTLRLERPERPAQLRAEGRTKRTGKRKSPKKSKKPSIEITDVDLGLEG